MKLLGDSGLKMAMAGMPFYFEKSIASGLIDKGIAIMVR
jgi:hypothetical protein